VSLPRLQFRETSVADLLQAHDYLEEQATSALADRFLMAVERTGEQIRRYPAAGSLFRPRLTALAGLRWWPIAEFSRHLIYYRLDSGIIDIVRVLHGARDAKRELSQP
jgi:toxin ParE1/3/4